jgi:hypothetical protein
MGLEELRVGTYVPIIPPEDGVSIFTRNVDIWMTKHAASYKHNRKFNLLYSTGFMHQYF